MNLQSILLLGGILAVALAVLIQHLRKQKRGGGCSSCQGNCRQGCCQK